MTFTPKEESQLRELAAQEQLCIEKYNKYSADATDGGLKNLFTAISQAESQHFTTLNTILSGTMPTEAGGGSKPAAPTTPAQYDPAGRENDSFLVRDALTAEKYVSSEYDASIFMFTDAAVRDKLNHIQKEEQEHGQQLTAFMTTNGFTE
jgi:spore coat protein CotF